MKNKKLLEINLKLKAETAKAEIKKIEIDDTMFTEFVDEKSSDELLENLMSEINNVKNNV